MKTIVIIGGGPAGAVAAERLARGGALARQPKMQGKSRANRYAYAHKIRGTFP